MKTKLVVFASASLLVLSSFSEPVITSVRGRVEMPDKVSEGVDVDGLSLENAVIRLEGDYKRPIMPFPADYSDKVPAERRAWITAFKKSEEGKAYNREVEEARAKRAVFTAEIAADGSFVFEGVPAEWYQLSAAIMHPAAEGGLSRNLARAYAVRQFVIKDSSQPYRVGTLKLDLKNVLMPGDTAPDWSAATYDGGEIKLSDFRGQFVLFDFWATWCGPCKAEIPNLEAVHEEFGGERFSMIGLSVDKTIDLPRTFHEQRPSTYLQGFMGVGDRYLKIRGAYGITGIPSIWLIDPDGKIIARDLRGEAVREAVNKALETLATTK